MLFWKNFLICWRWSWCQTLIMDSWNLSQCNKRGDASLASFIHKLKQKIRPLLLSYKISILLTKIRNRVIPLCNLHSFSTKSKQNLTKPLGNFSQSQFNYTKLGIKWCNSANCSPFFKILAHFYKILFSLLKIRKSSFLPLQIASP